MSASFGFDAATTYIRDGAEHTSICYNKYSVTPKGDQIFYDCSSSDAHEGSLCAYNQQKGTCKDSQCKLTGTPMLLCNLHHSSSEKQMGQRGTSVAESTMGVQLHVPLSPTPAVCWT